MAIWRLKHPCELCDAEYFGYEELLKHHKAKHNTIPITFNRYRCVFCKDSFETIDELESHDKAWHKEKEIEQEEVVKMAMDVAIPPLPKVDEVSCILEDREKRYSNFAHNAQVLQALKGTLHDQVTWKGLPFDSQLAIEMIILKIVRIVNGGMPDYIDNWLDIAGYATLVKNRIEGKEE
jgi:hypothetical protein